MAVKAKLGSSEETPAVSQELTPELVEQMKEYLVSQGLPPTLHKATFGKDVFVFRPLYRRDWASLQSFQQSNPNARLDMVDQKVCEMALLWPETAVNPILWDLQPAGYQQTLARFISAKSGFIDTELDGGAGFFVEPLVVSDPTPRPDEAVIEALKGKYRRQNLTLVSILDEHFVVRALNRTEWKGLVGQANSPDFETKVAERGTVWSSIDGEGDGANPINFNDKLAGIPKTLSQVIMESSGFAQAPVVETL